MKSMLALGALVAASVLTSHAVWAQGPASSDPIVQVGVFGYATDGSATSAAWDNEPSLQTTVYVSGTLCKVGAGNRTLPADAMHAWRFSGKVVSKNAEEAVLQLAWQRVLDRGQAVAGPDNVIELTLRAGDRVPLDTVIPESSACSSVSAAFEARFERERWPSLRSGSAAPRAGGSGASGTANTGRPNAPKVDSSRSQTPPPPAQMHVDLWLIHSAPNRQDEVFHQTVLAPRQRTDFAFPPVSITTPHGNATVRVNGSFSVTADQQLLFTTTRRVSRVDQPSRDRPTMNAGSGTVISAMPVPGDVLSFALPPIPPATGDAALPNQFSVRVRITPI